MGNCRREVKVGFRVRTTDAGELTHTYSVEEGGESKWTRSELIIMIEVRNMVDQIEAVKAAYAALNRGDVDGFVKDFDPEILRVEFEGSPTGGTYRGIEAVREHVAAGRSTWAEGACEPDRFVVAGDKVIVSCRVRVRLKDQTDWLEGRTTDVFTFRNGNVIEFRTFADENEALEYPGPNRER